LRQQHAEQHEAEEFPGEGPVRRCALTRASKPKDELIRFVLSPEGEIVPDLKEKLPGRGVWLSAAHDKVAEAAKRNVFAKALKAPAKVPADLALRVDRLLAEAALGAFALTNKAGEAVFGTAKVEDAIVKGRVMALVHAREAAPDGCRKLDGKLHATAKAPVSTVRTLGTDELGLASGRTNVIHAALIHGGAAAKFLAAALRLERYRKGSAAFSSRDRIDTDQE
jgi:predicted RNA-binding protein YlxR (DUF448 family)